MASQTAKAVAEAFEPVFRSKRMLQEKSSAGKQFPISHSDSMF